MVLRKFQEVTLLVVKLLVFLGTTQNQVAIQEEDVPGASLNGRDPSQLHVVELKRWLRCRGATTAGRKEDLVKRLAN